VHGEAIPGEASPGAFVQEEEPVITPKRPDQGVAPAALFEEPVQGAGEGTPGTSVPAQPDEGPVKKERQEAGAMGPADEVETPVQVPPRPPAGAAPDHMDDTGIPRPEPVAQAGLPDTVVFPVISDTPLSAAPEIPPAETPPTVQVPARQPPAPQPGRIPVRVMAVIILVMLAVIGGAAIILLHPSGNTDGPDHPAITPTQTLLPITTTAPVVIPTEGVWVKVMYNGTFVGTYGNPGDLREVRGTGEQIYAIKNTNDLVQASFTKQDDYGDILTVEVYNNGTRVTQVTKRTPGGTIAILVDPKTGKAPYVPVTTARA
jgi:hypothetical protein